MALFSKSKPRKKILLLSSKYKSLKIANRNRIPETVSFYTVTKFRMDAVDQMTRKYT